MLRLKLILFVSLFGMLESITPYTYFHSILRYYKTANRYKEDYIEETIINKFLKIKRYDFIIVGGGTSGCVIANRLSEVPEWKILLLEAGGDENFLTEVPVYVDNIQSTDANWKFKTAPQKNACLAMNDQRCTLNEGKIVGGSSSINNMIYSRGNKYDYDSWARQGSPNWGYQNVLPYFLKSEKNRISSLSDSPYHSSKGYWDVSTVPFRTLLADAFLDAGKEHGYNITDPNGESQLGFSFLQTNMRNGTRVSTSKAYLRPVQRRQNLHVLLNARVLKLEIDPQTKRVSSVLFTRNNKTYNAKMRREVILSAGAVNSAQLLMLSGVGPKKHLEEMNITPIADLKVGHNLQDRLAFIGLAFPVTSRLSLIDKRIFTSTFSLEYVFIGTGPLTVPGGIEAIAYLKSNGTNTHDILPSVPDVQLYLVSKSMNTEAGRIFSNTLGITEQVYNSVYLPIQNLDVWTIWPTILHPKSRGYVQLNSTDPYDKPIIDPNYLQERDDILMLVEGIKMAVNLSMSEVFKKYGTTMYKMPVPGCAALTFGTDQYWECAVKYLSVPMSHLAGTCKMGLDANAVVGPHLKVRGIEGLRVADASIMPTLPSADISAAVAMIGEKAADIIKKSYLKSKPKREKKH